MSKLTILNNMQNFSASWRPMNKIILIYCRMCNFSLIFSEQFWLNLILLVRLHFGIVRDYPRRYFALFQMECHMVEQPFCFVPDGVSVVEQKFCLDGVSRG